MIHKHSLAVFTSAPQAAAIILALALVPVLSSCRLPMLGCQKGYPDRVLGPMTYSPDGKWLAVGYYGRCEGEVEVWDVANLQQPPVVLPAHAEEVESLAFSGDSKLLAIGGGTGDGVVRVMDLSNLKGSPVELRGHARYVGSLAMSPDGHTLATVDLDDVLRIWDLKSPRPLSPSKVVNRTVATIDVAISPDGQTLAIAGTFLTDIELVKLTDPTTTVAVLHGVLTVGSKPVFSPDGRYVAIGASTANLSGTPVASLTRASLESAVELWDLSAPGRGPWLLMGNDGSTVSDVAFSSDGKWLSNTKVDAGLVEVWDMTEVIREALTGGDASVWSGKPARVFHNQAAYSVAFSPISNTLASGGMHDTIILWDYMQPSGAPIIIADPPPSDQ
jgi:WD40 repeat protein